MTPFKYAQSETGPGFIGRWRQRQRKKLQELIDRQVAYSAHCLSSYPETRNWARRRALEEIAAKPDLQKDAALAGELHRLWQELRKVNLPPGVVWDGGTYGPAFDGFSWTFPWHAKYYRAAWIREILKLR